MQYYGQQKAQSIYAGAHNYETTYATLSSKDVGLLIRYWLLERIMGSYWLKLPIILIKVLTTIFVLSPYGQPQHLATFLLH